MTPSLITWPPVNDVPDVPATSFDPESLVARQAARVRAEMGGRAEVLAIQAEAKREREWRERRDRGATRRVGRPVRCVETDEPFPSVGHAADAYAIRRSTCSEALRSGGRTLGTVSGEKRWLRFVRGEEAAVDVPPPRRPRNRPVVCIDTGTRYDSITEAAGGKNYPKIGRRATQLGEAIRLGRVWEGMRWGFATD